MFLAPNFYSHRAAMLRLHVYLSSREITDSSSIPCKCPTLTLDPGEKSQHEPE